MNQEEFRKLFQKNTISGRLLTSFLVSTLLPSVLITVILCGQFSSDYRRKVREQIQVSLELINYYTDSYLKAIDTVTTAPYYHSYFSSRKGLETGSSKYYSDLRDFQEELQALISLTTYSQPDISDQVVYSDGQYLYKILRNELWDTFDLETVEQQPWFLHGIEGQGKTVFTPVFPLDRETAQPDAQYDTSYFFISRQIRNLRQPDQVNMVMLSLSTRRFDQEFQSMGLVNDSYVVITNDHDELIYSGRPMTVESFSKLLAQGQFRHDGVQWNSATVSSSHFPLTIRVVYSMEDLHRQLWALVGKALMIYLAALIMAIVFYRNLNQWIRTSARTLQNTFAQVEKGNFQVQCPNMGIAEFDEIGDSLNNMITRLDAYIKNEYLMSIQQKNIQLYALQTQIRPHFIVNTIYSFIALNQMGMREQLNTAFYNLARLLRYVLSKERQSTVGQELSFLEDYLKLQQLRFGDHISYEIQCPQNLRSVTIPRLLLQPLVENAVNHGIKPCTHSCYCRILLSREGEKLVFRVIDNGVGFDPEQMERNSSQEADRVFNSTSPEPAKGSIGLYYVRERLSMWSENAEFRISRTDVTCSEIVIPLEDTNYEHPDR